MTHIAGNVSKAAPTAEDIINICDDIIRICQDGRSDIAASGVEIEKAESDTQSYSSGSNSDVEVADKTTEEGEQKEELNAWSRGLIGIPINYFSVGLVYAGSVSILYPVLVIQHGVDTAFFTAAASLVTVFWSYKIFFGILCDCLPIYGQKWRPYITVGVSSVEF